MPFNGWMDNQTLVHPQNGILVSNKRHTLLIHTATWVNLNGIMLSKQNQSQRLHTLWFHSYDILKITVTEDSLWVPGARMKEWYACKRPAPGSFCKEIQPVHSEGDQPWDFFGRNDAKVETPVLWPPHAKNWLIGKDSDAGRDWGQEEKGTTEDEMVGWHHRLNGLESEWTPGVGDGQGGLACCDSWGRKESDMTERLNWTDLKEFLEWWTVLHPDYVEYIHVLKLTQLYTPPKVTLPVC